MPMRYCMRHSGSIAALRSAILDWMATAHLTAFTTLANSARMPSPAVSMMRPAELAENREHDGLVPLEITDRARLVRAHQRAITGDICCQDGSEPARLAFTHGSFSGSFGRPCLGTTLNCSAKGYHTRGRW